MLASITPLGERGRGNRYWSTVSWHVLGAVLGGALAGAVAGAAGAAVDAALSPSSRAASLVAVVVISIAVVYDLRVGGLQLPTVRRQVNERWLDEYRPWVYGAGFGFQLGLGVVTIVTSAAIYAAFALALLTGSVALGAVVGSAFGLVRGLSVLTTARVRDPAGLQSLHRRLVAADGPVRAASIAVAAATILVALPFAAFVA